MMISLEFRILLCLAIALPIVVGYISRLKALAPRRDVSTFAQKTLAHPGIWSQYIANNTLSAFAAEAGCMHDLR
jgi:hypothetical protein